MTASLLRLEPETGRTHQLRVQLADAGHPILGDSRYGNYKANRLYSSRNSQGGSQIFLHALRIQWRDQQGILQRASAPLPESLQEQIPDELWPPSTTPNLTLPQLTSEVKK